MCCDVTVKCPLRLRDKQKDIFAWIGREKRHVYLCTDVLMCSFNIHLTENLLIPVTHVMTLEVGHQLPLKSALLPENRIDTSSWHLKNLLNTDKY